MTVRILAAAAAALALALLTGETPAEAQAPPANPLCLTLPNGAPQFVTGRGSSGGAGNALNTAHNNARNDWARLARYNNRPGQAGYDNWNHAARTNISSSSRRTGFTTTWTVVYVGQPCRPQ